MSQNEAKDRTAEQIVEEIRRRIKDGRFQDCPCKKLDCPRYGVCVECTAVHRSNSSLPVCLKNMQDRKAQ